MSTQSRRKREKEFQRQERQRRDEFARRKRVRQGRAEDDRPHPDELTPVELGHRWRDVAALLRAVASPNPPALPWCRGELEGRLRQLTDEVAFRLKKASGGGGGTVSGLLAAFTAEMTPADRTAWWASAGAIAKGEFDWRREWDKPGATPERDAPPSGR